MKTGYKVHDVMTNKPIVANRSDPVKEAAKLMKKFNVNSLVIKDGERAVGIFTDEDVVRKVVAEGLDVKKIKVEDIMEKSLITITPEKDIYDALLLMRNNNIRQLPVVDGKKKMVGYLTLKDILKIQPDLFDLIVDRYELREEEHKPVYETTAEEGVCQTCGKYAAKLFEVDGSLVCHNCKKNM